MLTRVTTDCQTADRMFLLVKRLTMLKRCIHTSEGECGLLIDSLTPLFFYYGNDCGQINQVNVTLLIYSVRRMLRWSQLLSDAVLTFNIEISVPLASHR